MTKVKSLTQIANEYNIHRNTLKKWLKPIMKELRINKQRLLKPWQVELIYNFLDKPEIPDTEVDL